MAASARRIRHRFSARTAQRQWRRRRSDIAMMRRANCRPLCAAASCGRRAKTCAMPPIRPLRRSSVNRAPLDVDGLQGNETWRVRRDDEPPLGTYFIDYDDAFNEDAARGHMGDIAIVRACPSLPSRQIQIFPTTPGGPPGGHPGTPGHRANRGRRRAVETLRPAVRPIRRATSRPASADNARDRTS